jgi:hypothetical protein
MGIYIKIAIIIIFLFDTSFVSQIREYFHKCIIVNVNIVQYNRMVDLAKFLDEFLYGMLFSLISSVLHNKADHEIL